MGESLGKSTWVVYGHVGRYGTLHPFSNLSYFKRFQSKVVTNTSSPAYILADGNSRKKRAVVIEPVEVVGPGGKKMMVVTLDCDQRSQGYSSAKCFKFTCQIGLLLKNKRAVIRIRARLWNSTFIEVSRRTVKARLVASVGSKDRYSQVVLANHAKPHNLITQQTKYATTRSLVPAGLLWSSAAWCDISNRGHVKTFSRPHDVLSFSLQDYPNVDSVRILSKAQVKLDPKDNIQQEKKSNDLAYVSRVLFSYSLS